jgi:hypothetical protein
MYSLAFCPRGWDFPPSFKSARTMPQVLTANRLKPGEVVYWNEKAGWVLDLDEAEIIPDDRAEEALKAAGQWIAKREIVAPYLFEVRVKDGAVVPLKIREAIRAAGPTVRPDLGKQAL